MIIAQSALEAILTKENVHQTAYIITVIMFIYLFIYQLFWTQASPEGMCTNGTQVPCEVPSLPNPTTRKGWPHHRSLRPLLFSKSDVGSFTSHKNKAGKVLCTVFRPYPRRLESLTICRCHYKGSTFSSVILRPWVLVQLGFEPANSRSADRRSPNWANHAAV